MKKLFCLLIASVMMFSMVACGMNETEEVAVGNSDEIEQFEN